jgi:hypothetical protein
MTPTEASVKSLHLGGEMSFLKPKLAPWYGFGIFLAQAPSVADPAGLYKAILTIHFWRWSTRFCFGRN